MYSLGGGQVQTSNLFEHVVESRSSLVKAHPYAT